MKLQAKLTVMYETCSAFRALHPNISLGTLPLSLACSYDSSNNFASAHNLGHVIRMKHYRFPRITYHFNAKHMDIISEASAQ